jgi:hypothetical protein
MIRSVEDSRTASIASAAVLARPRIDLYPGVLGQRDLYERHHVGVVIHHHQYLHSKDPSATGTV